MLFNTSSETGTPGQCVINVNLSLQALVAARRKRGPKFRLEFPGLDLQPIGTRNSERLCQRAERNFRSPKSWSKR
jgi:hypothetical protein